jgi:hypothetical protein
MDVNSNEYSKRVCIGHIMLSLEPTRHLSTTLRTEVLEALETLPLEALEGLHVVVKTRRNKRPKEMTL